MPTLRSRPGDRPTSTAARPAVGPGAALALIYGFFTLAAGARSGVQLATHAGRAPVAYALSAVAAAMYLTGAFVLHGLDRHPGWRARATGLCAAELAGVLLVGTVSLLWPGDFPDATVWSGYGSGYGYVPAVLPVLALTWLHGRRAEPPVGGDGHARGGSRGRGRHGDPGAGHRW